MKSTFLQCQVPWGSDRPLSSCTLKRWKIKHQHRTQGKRLPTWGLPTDHRVPGRQLEIKSGLCPWVDPERRILHNWPENRQYWFLITSNTYHVNFFINLWINKNYNLYRNQLLLTSPAAFSGELTRKCLSWLWIALFWKPASPSLIALDNVGQTQFFEDV